MGKIKNLSITQRVYPLIRDPFWLLDGIEKAQGVLNKIVENLSSAPPDTEDKDIFKIPLFVILTGADYPSESEVEEGLLKLRTYWRPKLSEWPILASGLWKRGPESLRGIAAYVGSDSIFEGAKKIYDKEGNLYYASADVRYEGFLTEKEHERMEKEKLEQAISSFRYVLLEKIEQKPILSEDVDKLIPKELSLMRQEKGRQGVLKLLEDAGIVEYYDKTGKTYWGLSKP